MPIKAHNCFMCGRELNFVNLFAEYQIAKCQACDRQFLIGKDGAIKLFNDADRMHISRQMHEQAEQFMQKGNYTSASGLYQQIIKHLDLADSNAYWGLFRISVDNFKPLQRSDKRSDVENRKKQLSENQDYLRAKECGTSEQLTQYKNTVRSYEEQIVKYEEQATKHERQKALRKRVAIAFLILLMVAIAWALLQTFVVTPGNSYNNAVQALESGDYAKAKEMFGKLGGYGDSEQNVALSEALLDLQQGNYNSVLNAIGSLNAQSKGKTQAAQVKRMLIDTLAKWQEKRIPPKALLALLASRDIFDEAHTLDVEALFIGAHVELIGGSALLAWRVPEDQKKTLIAIEKDFDVRVYQMLDLDTQPLNVDAQMKADELVRFGGEKAGDLSLALACYLKALEWKDSPAVRERAAGVYQAMTEQSRVAGDNKAALTSAQSAWNIYDTKDTFDGLYQTQDALVQRETNMPTAIAAWDAFMAVQQDGLSRYGYAAGASVRAGELRLAYADELVSLKDPQAVQWYEDAEKFGVDIADALARAASASSLGYFRVSLRMMAMNRLPETARQEDRTAQLALLQDDIVQTLRSRQTVGLSVPQVFELLHVADGYGVTLESAVRSEAYQQAALQVIGGEQSLLAWAFVSWDGPDAQSLLALTKEKDLVYYRYTGTFDKVFSYSVTDMSSPSMLILTEFASPTIILTDVRDGQTVAFSTFVYRENSLLSAYSEKALVAYQLNEGTISFSLALPGSIDRRAEYRYALSAPNDKPQQLQVTWQQENYPMPTGAQDAVIRYFEAAGYAIDGEIARLVSGAPKVTQDASFSMEALQALPRPDMPLRITEASYLYLADGEQTNLEVSYVSGNRRCLAYVAVQREESVWRIIGALPQQNPFAASFGEDAMEALSLNQKMQGMLPDEKQMQRYRVLLPFPAQVALLWYPEGTTKEATYQVQLFWQGEQKSYLTYTLQRSDKLQQSVPLALPSGVYEIALSTTYTKGAAYQFSFNAVRDDHAELEHNDTLATATPILPNQSIHAGLHVPSDIDLYAITLEQPGAITVNLSFDAPDKLDNREYFTVDIAKGGSANVLYHATVTGENASTRLHTLYVGAGTYYIQISAAKSWSNRPYTLAVNYDDEVKAEQEWNNTLESATPIVADTAYYGIASYAGDPDYYRLTLDEGGLLQIQFAQTPLASGKASYALHVFSDAQPAQELWTGEIPGGAPNVGTPPLTLTAGTYTIFIENKVLNLSGYTLTPMLKTGFQIELEPNNDLASATPMLPNQDIVGSLITAKDIDLFTFTLEEPGAVTVNLAFDAPDKSDSKEYFTVDVAQRGNANVLYHATVTGEKASTRLHTLYVGAGTYYIQISAAKSWSNRPYTLAVNYNANVKAEQEWNNTPESATPVGVDTAYLGIASYAGDPDYYRLTLTEGGLLQIQFTQTPLTSQKAAYTLHILSDVQPIQELWTGEIPGGAPNASTPPLALTAGSYTILIENKVLNLSGYILQPMLETSSLIETEPNNDVASATVMPVNQPIVGSLMTEKDVDLFAFTLEEPGAVIFSLGFDAGTRKETAYTLTIAEGGHYRALYSTKISGDPATQQTPPLLLDAGRYIVQITAAERWTLVPYTLTAHFEPDAYAEREPNDTPENATPLPLDTPIRGSSRVTGDVDYYRFELSQPGVVAIEWDMPPASANKKETFSLAVYGDAQPQPLLDASIKGNEHIKRFPVCLQPGIYLLAVENKLAFGEEYRITARFTADSAIEAEPNNTPQRATKLTLGHALTGVLSGQADTDWYELTMEQDVEVIFTLTLGTLDAAEGNVQLNLEHNGRSAWKQKVPIGGDGMQVSMKLPKGVYSLCVSADQANIPYKVEFRQ
ncbi:hypothetical protein FACS1894196_2420 [Clostridia bacterium]|nr:hypothetical protein FACS1894196_2420 [Clostridia bacterium]